MSREFILHRIRTALGRRVGDPPGEEPPLARLKVTESDLAARIRQFQTALENLGGVFFEASSPAQARGFVAKLLDGKTAVASNAPLLEECGITSLAQVASGFSDAARLREAAATADVGITGADYLVADTGTVALFSSREEARVISLLPPVHVAVASRERLLSGLDELFLREPEPARRSSSLVLITGPSRTADIEQILVRGVHGPGAIYVVLL